MDSNGSALTCNVLVLNRHYQALRVVQAKRAFSLLFRRLAEVVAVEQDTYNTYDFQSWAELSELRRQFAPDGQDWVHTVRLTIAVPRIIRLLFYDRLPRQQVKFNRRNIYARDHSRCQYCGNRYPSSELSLDHVVPRSCGGKTVWGNVVCCCTSCNVKKGGRLPAQAGMKLIAKPVKPRRSPLIHLRLGLDKYASWKQFLDHAYWSVELH